MQGVTPKGEHWAHHHGYEVNRAVSAWLEENSTRVSTDPVAKQELQDLAVNTVRASMAAHGLEDAVDTEVLHFAKYVIEFELFMCFLKR